MTPTRRTGTVRLALPKGRMQEGVFRLLRGTGIELRSSERGYRPTVSLPGFETKLLKPRNVVEMLHAGARDVGFAGADWVEESEAELIELVDTGLDRVTIVAAAPAAWADLEALRGRPDTVVASEYERLTKAWIERRELDARVLRTFGATEVFPPEDADAIVDNTATGSTLVANGLEVVDELMTSTTRLYASREAMDDPVRREAVEGLAMLVESVVEAQDRVLFEVNVPSERLERVCEILPCMQQPTIASLVGELGFGVKGAVRRAELPRLVREIKDAGGTDIVVTPLSQVIR